MRSSVLRQWTYRGALYDGSGDVVLQFLARDKVRWFAGKSYVQGRHLEVRDATRQLIGTLVAEERASRGIFQDGSGKCIGAIKKPRGWLSTPHADCLIDDSTGKRVGWIATPRINAKRLADIGFPVQAESLKRKWFGSESQERHILSIISRISRDLRLLMLATSAAIHLGVVDTPGDPD